MGCCRASRQGESYGENHPHSRKIVRHSPYYRDEVVMDRIVVLQGDLHEHHIPAAPDTLDEWWCPFSAIVATNGRSE